MDEERPSVTAESAAVVRALHQTLDGEPKILDDPISPRLIDPHSALYQNMHDLDEPRQREIERKLSRSLPACGCGEGAALGLLYLFGILALPVAGGGPSSLFQWCLALIGFCMTVTAGKLAGIGIARLRLSRQIRSMGNFIAEKGSEK